MCLLNNSDFIHGTFQYEFIDAVHVKLVKKVGDNEKNGFQGNKGKCVSQSAARLYNSMER